MSKWFEVEVQTLTVCVVEVNDDQNENHAANRISCVQRVRGKQTFTALPLPGGHLRTIKQNCDYLEPLIDERDGDAGEADDQDGG